MKAAHSKKHLLLAALFAAGITAGLSQVSIAASDSPAPAPSPMPQNAPWNCPRWSDDPAMQQKHAQFLDETKELRRQLAVKEAGMRALMQSAQPDNAQAAQLAGELFDLREQLRAKAQASGLPMGMMGGHHGMGMGKGKGGCGPCDGSGPNGGGRYHGNRR